MKSAIDLYSGIGGWTLGMKLSGIENLASFEWWKEANQTHNINFNTNHKEINIREIDVNNYPIFKKKIDFVVGSPPCTQFSFSNRGGNGNIQDGLIDIFKFLEIVEFIKPKYWAMENIPRVADILEEELNNGSLKRFKPLVKVIKVVDCSEYGLPQSRKRMIAGDFPVSLFESYKSNIKTKTLGNVLNSLNNNTITDLNYNYRIPRNEITELENEVDLTDEEERINRDSKTFHPVYNNMSFPDKLNKPSRTITATCTRVSRESIIVKSNNRFRRLNVRERGIIQGFPITFQFYGNTLNSKFKLIGNAIPPVLTYYIFQSMLGVKLNSLKFPTNSTYYHVKPSIEPIISNLGLPVKKYPLNRKFQFAIPNLRYGSGVRFELSNNLKSEELEWSFKFFYGSSKKIKQVLLNQILIEILIPVLKKSELKFLNENIENIYKKYKGISSKKLQNIWISTNSNMEAFNFIDDIGKHVEHIVDSSNLNNVNIDIAETILNEKNKKLENNIRSFLIGCYLLSSLNIKIFKL